MGVILTAFSFLSCYFSSKKYHIREGGMKKILFFDKKIKNFTLKSAVFHDIGLKAFIKI